MYFFKSTLWHIENRLLIKTVACAYMTVSVVPAMGIETKPLE